MTASEILRPKEDKKDVKGLTQDLIGMHLSGDKKAWLGEFCFGMTNHPDQPPFFQGLTLNLKMMVSEAGIVPIPGCLFLGVM